MNEQLQIQMDYLTGLLSNPQPESQLWYVLLAGAYGHLQRTIEEVHDPLLRGFDTPAVDDVVWREGLAILEEAIDFNYKHRRGD